MASINKANTTKEAATPNFVLTLLAACSNSVPAAGREGEAKVSEQLSGLLQSKAMTVEELQLLYSYKYGFSIDDALQFAGFNGKTQEFLDEQKCFSIQEGVVCVKLDAVLATVDEPPTQGGATEIEEHVATIVVGEGLPAQHALPIAQDFGFTNVDDDDCACSADTDSTTDDSESSRLDEQVDIPGWHSLGNRLVAALGKDIDVHDDGLRWKVLGGRIATALSSDGSDSEDEDNDDDATNIAAWQDVGNRVATACKFDDAVEVSV